MDFLKRILADVLTAMFFLLPVVAFIALGLVLSACASRRDADNAYWSRATPEIARSLNR